MRDKYNDIFSKFQTVLKIKEQFMFNPSSLTCKRYKDHLNMYSELVDVVINDFSFIICSLIKEHEYDPLKPIMQIHLINFCFSNELFLHLLVSCSITNRLKKACKEKNMPIELKERIRDCMVVYLKCS